MARIGLTRNENVSTLSLHHLILLMLIPKRIEDARLRQESEAPEHERLCDWAERAQPTSMQLQRRRVYNQRT